MKPDSDRANTARLLISCTDQPGIVASVSEFLYAHGANILDSDQHTTNATNGTFFMRMEFHLKDLDLSRRQFEQAFQASVASKFSMIWRIAYTDITKRMAIMVSKYDHCLLELIWRHRSQEFDVEIPLIISNHDDLRTVSESYGYDYHFLPISKATKAKQEKQVLEMIAQHNIDFVVLARYMQILSPEFVAALPGRIINIHHSFLPAFIGANPYKHAYQRGVKLIGATAHYVTDDLDEGPIIEQDVQRVSHRESSKDLMQIGRVVERTVLARAVAAHLDDRILLHGNKTVVFE